MAHEGPRWLDDHEQVAWRGYLQMQARLEAALGRQLQADSDLSAADFAVLVSLTDRPDGRARVLELARALDWEKSRLSHHLARMHRRGLICRDGCDEDKRGSYVTVTDAGRAAVEAAAPAHVATVRRLVFDVLSADDVAALASISQRVLAQIEASSLCDE